MIINKFPTCIDKPAYNPVLINLINIDVAFLGLPTLCSAACGWVGWACS